MSRYFSRRAALVLLGLACLPGAVRMAFAEPAYPSRPVNIVVPFAPGGGADIVARTLAKSLGEQFGQSFVVDNRSGAGGVIGTTIVARAAPDGYTLLFAPSSHVVNPAVMATLPYDTERAFEPISLVASATVLLGVNPKVPASSLKDFIALVRKPENNRLANYGSAGNGTPFHLVSEQFKRATGVEMQHIAYRGGSPATTALVAGEVPFLFETAITLSPFAKSGAVRLLAVMSKQRTPLFPDVPTIGELGYPELTFSNDYGLYAPAGTPPAVIQAMAAAVAKAVRSPEVQATLTAQGTVPVGSTPDELRSYVHREIKRWKAVAQTSHITLN